MLAAHFLAQASRRLNVPPARLTSANIIQLQAYDWPGNVRELQNTIERALILAQNGALNFDLLTTDDGSTGAVSPVMAERANDTVLTETEFRHRERENVAVALKKARWKVHGPGGAAELLGLKPTTLISRMKKLGLGKPPSQ